MCTDAPGPDVDLHRAAKTHVIQNKGRAIQDDYHVEREKIGKGGFGSVRAGAHRRTNVVRAIKSTPHAKLAERRLLGGRKHEVDIMQAVDHPHIVKLVETFEDPTHIHMVMEMCSGGSLAEHIKLAHDSFGPGVSEEELARITIQMLQGVAYCHAHSVAHRDIKPQNLLFSCGSPVKGSAIPIACSGHGDAPLKLVDFGIAGVVRSDQPGKRLLTKSAGTKGFMAPEVLGSKPYDGCAADMFSIGAVMHNMMVGLPPSWDTGKQSYKFPGRVRWASFSDDCRSLLDHLLLVEPSLRPTASEALQHPWFKSMGVPALPSALCAIFDACFRRMHAFSHLSKLQQVLVYSMVAFAPLHNHHMEQLRVAFLAADTGDSRGISCFRFVELGRRYSDLSSAELRGMFSEADFSKTGKISYCEWLAAACPSDWVETHDHKLRAFETLDVRRNGYICATDLCQLLPHVFDLDEMKKEIFEAFPEGEGNLTFKDFCTLVAGKPAICRGEPNNLTLRSSAM